MWDMVTPSLRAVAVRPVYPLIEARFIFEAVGEEEQMVAAEVETYVVADFLPTVDVRFLAVPVPPGAPLVLLPEEEWVYRRREKSEM